MPVFLFCKHSFEYSVLIIKSANEYKKKVSNQTDCYTLPGNSSAEKHDFTDLWLSRRVQYKPTSPIKLQQSTNVIVKHNIHDRLL